MQKARDLMRRPVIATSPQTPAEEAIELLVENELSAIPVVDPQGHVVGVFAEDDQIEFDSLSGRSVQQVMTRQVVTVDAQDSLVDVTHAFKDLPVTENGAVVGTIGLSDLVRHFRDNERNLGAIAPVLRELVQSECWCNAD